MRQVELCPTRERLEERATQKRLVLRERVRDANVRLFRRVDEGHWTRLEQPQPDERFAYARRDRPERIVDSRRGPERTDLVRKPVVTVKAGDFLDEIDLLDDVASPARRARDDILRRGSSDLEPGAFEIALHGADGYGFPEHLLDALQAQANLGASRQLTDDIDRRVRELAAGDRHDEAEHTIHRARRQLRVHTALEPVARVGRQTERTPRRTGEPGIEARDLDQQIVRPGRHFAFTATHHAGDGLGPFRVGDDDDVVGKYPGHSIESRELLVRARGPDDDLAAGEFSQIEGVYRLSELVEHVVGRVYHIADGAHADRVQTPHEPLGTWPHLHPANDGGHIATRLGCRVDGDVDSGRAPRVLRRLRRLSFRREIRNLRQAPFPTGHRRDLARQPQVREQVRSVGAHIDDQSGIACRHDREEPRARRRVDVELHDALMILAEAELARGAEHSVGVDAADLATVQLRSEEH